MICFSPFVCRICMYVCIKYIYQEICMDIVQSYLCLSIHVSSLHEKSFWTEQIYNKEHKFDCVCMSMCLSYLCMHVVYVSFYIINAIPPVTMGWHLKPLPKAEHYVQNNRTSNTNIFNFALLYLCLYFSTLTWFLLFQFSLKPERGCVFLFSARCEYFFSFSIKVSENLL